MSTEYVVDNLVVTFFAPYLIYSNIKSKVIVPYDLKEKRIVRHGDRYDWEQGWD